MKSCPICGASAFDDASTCYGCLHQYAPGDQASPVAATVEQPARAAARSPQFLITLDPVERVGGFAWSCSVEPLTA